MRRPERIVILVGGMSAVSPQPDATSAPPVAQRLARELGATQEDVAATGCKTLRGKTVFGERLNVNRALG